MKLRKHSKIAITIFIIVMVALFITLQITKIPDNVSIKDVYYTTMGLLVIYFAHYGWNTLCNTDYINQLEERIKKLEKQDGI